MAWVNYKINNWLLIPTENCLFKSGKSYILEPRITKLLAFFAKHPGMVFTRDELIEDIWDGAVVSEQVVTQSIFELRKILKKMTADHWIITIPKRGYKLDADVQQIFVDPDTGFKLEEFHSSYEHKSNESSNSYFPAGPMTRAFHETSKEIHPPIDKKENTAKWNHWFFDISILSMLFFTIVFITWSNNEIKVTHPILNPNLINLEPADITSSNQLLSITKIIQKELFRNTYYISNIGHQENAGKTLLLYMNQNHQVQIELYNNISKKIIFAQRFSLKTKDLTLDLNKVINGLLNTLTYKNNFHNTHYFQFSPILLSEYINLPNIFDEDGHTNLTYIDKINKLIKSAPKNTYLLAQRYLAYATIMTLDNKETSTPTLMSYGRELEKNITLNKQQFPSEVYDALALNALYQGDIASSRYYLGQAKLDSNQNTSLRYILLGKMAELANKSNLANEYYNMAQYLSPSNETTQLCQSLVFHSRLIPSSSTR